MYMITDYLYSKISGTEWTTRYQNTVRTLKAK